MLHDHSVVHSDEFDSNIHGHRIYCIDKSCSAEVIHVPGSNKFSSHFKTTGSSNSKHSERCGFYNQLTVTEAVEKIGEYQQDLFDRGIKETLLKINMNKIDPDYESNSNGRETTEDKKAPDLKVKDENKPPQTIGSVKSIVKLLTGYEPDVLASIIVNVGKGNKVPLSDVLVNQDKAHNILFGDKALPCGYFVYGKVERIAKRKKVKYINFTSEEKETFTIVLFNKYWKHFSYSDADLKGREILVYGYLRKNTYGDKNQTEMMIKSDKYLELLPNK